MLTRYKSVIRTALERALIVFDKYVEPKAIFRVDYRDGPDKAEPVTWKEAVAASKKYGARAIVHTQLDKEVWIKHDWY